MEWTSITVWTINILIKLEHEIDESFNENCPLNDKGWRD